MCSRIAAAALNKFTALYPMVSAYTAPPTRRVGKDGQVAARRRGTYEGIKKWEAWVVGTWGGGSRRCAGGAASGTDADRDSQRLIDFGWDEPCPSPLRVRKRDTLKRGSRSTTPSPLSRATRQRPDTGDVLFRDGTHPQRQLCVHSEIDFSPRSKETLNKHRICGGA
jgi:hypothetical protein